MITNSLPVQPTPFIGRDRELAEIARLLADPTCKLLTLVGPGGIGKTRLALEAARLIVEDTTASLFPHGAYFATLQALTSPDFVASAVAEAVSFQFYPGSDPKQQLLDYFREKRLLLVLDNFEHLLESASLVSDILTHAAYVKVLVTSRERLNLREEWVFDVLGLDVPASETVAKAESYSAIQLFVQNARRTHVGFTLTDSQLAAVVRICQMVEGMPLGIEMASARVRVLSCEQIAGELEQSLDILEMPARNVPSRHRSIRAAFEPTWQRLSEVERDVFKNLSVFRGGFTPEAARMVAGASLRTLSSLVDKSLLRVGIDGRYDLHELLRQYGEEQLKLAAEESAQIRNHHCAYYAEFVRQRREEMLGPGMKEALDSVGAALENAQAAWAWAVSQAKWTEVWKFISGLQRFCYHRGRFQDAVTAYGLAVNRLEKTESTAEGDALLGCLLANYAFFGGYVGLKKESEESCRGSLALLQQLDDLGARWETVEALTVLGWTERQVRPFDAQRYCRESAAIARTRGYLHELEWALIVLATIDLWVLDDFVEGKQATEEALPIARQFGHPFGMACCCWFLGQVAFNGGQYAEAKRLEWESYRILNDEIGNRYNLTTSLLYLGEIALAEHDSSEARRVLREALLITKETSYLRYLHALFTVIADLLVREDKAELAVEVCALVLDQPTVILFNPARRATHLLQRLQGHIPPDIFATAVQRGRARNLDETIDELIAQLSQASAPDASKTTETPHDPLTRRELEILQLIATGQSNREIASKLVLSVGTVKWYVSQICSKLDAKNRTQAITRAKDFNLFS